MDPFRICVAFGPLAAYLLLLGLVNVARRPRMTTGAKNLVALGLALSGMIVVGPMELFLPERAAANFGSYVWLLLLSLYGLTVSFAALVSRPKLVIFNITSDELRPILAETVVQLDPEARWAGDALSLPSLGVQLHLDSFPSMRNVSLVAGGDRQSFAGWRRLELALYPALRAAQVQFNPRGVSMIGFALLLLATCLIHSLGNPQALAQGFRDLLRL